MIIETNERVQFKVPFEGQQDKQLDVTTYAFDRQGNLLASAPVANGVANLALPTEDATYARLFIAPTLPKERGKMPTIELMQRLQAYEPVWNFDRRQREYNLLPVPEAVSKLWLWRRCRVRGRVVKPVEVKGITYDMPICYARVHVCEVDPLLLIIPRLPDDLILRLRDEFIHVIENPIPGPIPEPDPPFRFDPGVIDPSPEAIARLNRPLDAVQLNGNVSQRFSAINQVALNPQPLPPLASTLRSSELGLGSSVMLNPQPEPPARFLTPVLSLETKALLSSPSVTTVRQGLLTNVKLIRPYLCLWNWLLPYLRCDEVAIIETDTQGNFDTSIWYLLTGDRPDLYFWVEYSIGGTWTTVYRPPVRCHTYWNYACGSQVTIRVTDPRVPWCNEPPNLPGLQVGILTIGNNVSIPEIQKSAAGMAEGLTTAGEPFGGSLEPHVWFGTALLAAGISHYRWSYRRQGEGDDAWRAMDRQVVRHYSDIAADGTLVFKPYLLGPDPNPALVGKNLFKIQPQNPPTGIWAPQVDARENSASAFFLSYKEEGGDALAAGGKYELKLELFRADGTLVNLTDAGVQLKVPTIAAPFGASTVPTSAPAPENVILDGDSKVVAFRLVVHVDNNPCEAEIYTVSGSGLTIDADCGFLGYNPGATVNLSFKARHPNNFATFSFGTYRGSSIYIPEASAGGAVGSSPVDGFTRNAASVFSKTGIPVLTLLSSNNPPDKEACSKAAFAETLYVRAIATDGWSTLSYLDRASIPKAFALAPQE